MAGTTTLRVFRWRAGGDERFDQFEVTAGPETTVLDALVDAQRSRDSTLAFRYACRVGMCGSCAMVVNGRERWACRTRLATLGAGSTAARSNVVITVRPLYHFPPVLGREGFAFSPAAESGADPPGHARRPSPRPTNEDSAAPDYAVVSRESAERREIDAAIECIGCGMCVSACTMVAHNERFPGPAALNRARSRCSETTATPRRTRGGRCCSVTTRSRGATARAIAPRSARWKSRRRRRSSASGAWERAGCSAFLDRNRAPR